MSVEKPAFGVAHPTVIPGSYEEREMETPHTDSDVSDVSEDIDE